jgi:Bax protein
MVKTLSWLLLGTTALLAGDITAAHTRVIPPIAVVDEIKPVITVANPREASFINTLLPSIQRVNAIVQNERNQLVDLHEHFLTGKIPESMEQIWLTNLADKYHINNADFTDDATWTKLLTRVDIIPASMVLAQAANESAWGHSRFAQNGNNYFGQFCYSRGCGIVPKNQYEGGKRHELQSFGSVHAAVASYVHNLNTNPAYNKLRQLRYAARQQGEPVKGTILATGLVHYSSNGMQYVHIIRNLIQNYKLDAWDQVEA